ncbi:Hypothetical predicted protein [Pelobates cultripes]|uniref:Uncharacterized protein n=1 Tax=Pelobates cultripes TaxID=61616 RepID=A0AAD1TI33_PELCU|nr:Hypothetical predicted protein [Pelobates cultripes]
MFKMPMNTSRAPHNHNPGNEYTPEPVPTAHGPVLYRSAPGGYAPAPPAGPCQYVPPGLNGYGPAPQPMGQPYAPLPGPGIERYPPPEMNPMYMAPYAPLPWANHTMELWH